MKKIFLVLLSLCICLVSCKKTSFPLEGEWETYSFEIDGVMQEICISGFTMEGKSNGKYDFNGNSGVNSFFGSVKISDNNFKVQDNMGSTKMAGEPRAMEFEDNFIPAFARANSWKVTEEGNATLLTLKTEDGSRVLVFKKNK